MLPNPTSISAVIRNITTPWSPVELARVNDQIVRIALFQGEYHWHVHENEEELFLVHEGEIIIQMKGQPDLVLKSGDIGVVPKGVEHCPKSAGKSYVLMFEPLELKSSGSSRK